MKVAGIFFDEPTIPHYLIEISKKSRLAHTSTKKYLISLKKEGIISETIEKKGKRNFPTFKANLENQSYKQQKTVHNILKIYNSGLINFLRDNCTPKVIILFGSYSRGEDTEKSDIDVFVESKKRALNFKKFEGALKRKIEIHFNNSFNNYPKELKNNILNGNVLYGYLEAFK